MRLFGTYKNINEDTISVDIVSKHGSTTVEIGNSNTYFADDPITIKCSVDDTFDNIIKSKCKIKLLTKDYLGTELFATNARDIKVTIKKNDTCIFSGFVVPCTYSQSYMDEYDEFTINCVDKLSTLCNYNFNNVKADTYKQSKINAGNLSFASMIKSILNKASTDQGTTGNIYYDNSRSVDSKDAFFDNLYANSLLFFGNEEDDIWNQEEVLEEMLKYCTLNIRLVGHHYFIFDYNTFKDKTSIKWTNLNTNTNTTKSITTHNLVAADYCSSDTSVTVDDVFNLLLLKCEIEGVEDLIKSPLDKDSLTSPYTNKNKYITESLLIEKNDGAYTPIPETKKKYNTWYYQYYNNSDWNLKFLQGTTVRDVDTLVQRDSNGIAINQNKIAETAKNYDLFPMISKFGKVKEADASDNSVSNKIDMNNYLTIQVNGTNPLESEFETKSAATITKWNNIVDKTGGIIQYNATGSGASITPSDDSVTNYIVFTGSIALQPAIPKQLAYSDGAWVVDYPMVGYKYFDGATYPKDQGTPINKAVMMPYLDYPELRTAFKEYYGEWFYYKDEDDTDTISKVPILVCELKIGDKYCVETDDSVFEWLTASEATAKGLNTTFALGIDPKLNDYLLENEFDIQTTKMPNIELDGTGIPIKKSDNLSGNISFKILSPSYTGWNQQIRRHPTAFRHTKWWTTNLPLMEFVETIYIKNFECKIVSDNGGINNFGDNDLIYMSNENVEYIKKKDNIKFKLNTQLTASECLEKGVSNEINISSVFDSNNQTIKTIQDKNLNVEGKAEEVYLNHYYTEYCEPKVIYETQIHSNDYSWLYRYRDTFLHKTFFVLEWNLNPTTDTVTCKLKEV